MERLRPTPRQLDFLSWEFGVFFHFGIRSFYRGSQDWDQQAMDLQVFDPKELDCRSWVRTAKEAGAAYAVLTAKHHDGFALWPTQHSPCSVKNTPWKDGQGDVVREFVEACRAEGVRPCLYYSPAQWGEGPRWDDQHAYDDYFEKQITELLTWYGPIDYLWFDGAFSQGHRYDKRRIVQRIRSLQPDILLFNLWDPDTRWIGNEAGFAPLDMRYVVNGLKEEMCLGDADEPGSSRFLPPECDFKMRSTWFDCEDNEDTVKSVQELVAIWEQSVGRGCNMLLNIGPEARGLLPHKDTERLHEFTHALKKKYGVPAPGSLIREVNSLTLELSGAPLIDRVLLQEDLLDGQQVDGFRLWANVPGGTATLLIYQGHSIGHKQVCAFPPIRAAKLSLRYEPQSALGSVTSMAAYTV